MAADDEDTRPDQELAKSGKDTAKPKDRWDKIDILLKPVGGLFTGIALAVVGYFTTDLLEEQQAQQTIRLAQQQAQETNRRLYAEIMSSRERADTDLRKDMFNTVIQSFLDPSKSTLDEQVLALELLAYNFHDVIDIGPLFKYVAKEVGKSKHKNKAALNRQLERVATEVIEKQLAALEEGGIRVELILNFDEIDKSGQPLDERVYPIRVDRPELRGKRYIYVEALQIFEDKREIRVRLETGELGDPNDPENFRVPELDINFKVGFFDFPMIDNTRVSHSQRIGVALTRWSQYGAEVNLIYFPGSRASLKEKPYYDELIDQLKMTSAVLLEGDQ